MRAGEAVAGWSGLFPARSPVWKLRLLEALEPGSPGQVSLPWEVLWALSLNEGDLVAGSLEEDSAGCRFRFRSHGRRVRSAVESCGEPWPWVEELLRHPMSAVGPAGSLELEGLAPGEPLVLQAEVWQSDSWFTLERAGGKRPCPLLSAQARYRLVVEPGFKVTFPADALFALSLARGSAVGYRTALWVCEGWPAGERDAQGHLEIGEGGAVPLPRKLWEYAALKPGSPVSLEVRLATDESGFRLEPDLPLPESHG